MKNKKAALDAIIEEIFVLSDPKIDRSREQVLKDFIDTAINGDKAESYLVVNADLGNGVDGAIVYILTNLRLIKIDIDSESAELYKFYLRSIMSMENKILPDDHSEFKISFPNGYAFGLRSSGSDKKVSKFLQDMDRVVGEQERKHG